MFQNDCERGEYCAPAIERCGDDVPLVEIPGNCRFDDPAVISRQEETADLYRVMRTAGSIPAILLKALIVAIEVHKL